MRPYKSLFILHIILGTPDTSGLPHEFFKYKTILNIMLVKFSVSGDKDWMNSYILCMGLVPVLAETYQRFPTCSR